MGCFCLLQLPIVEVQVEDSLPFPVGEDLAVSAKENAVLPSDAAQPDGQTGCSQPGAHLGRESRALH